jgi:hypothetical protein
VKLANRLLPNFSLAPKLRILESKSGRISENLTASLNDMKHVDYDSLLSDIPDKTSDGNDSDSEGNVEHNFLFTMDSVDPKF